ncbi:MAG: energy-coupling factor transporter transmembrane protein EcfT [Defluviitaleaceae bacterium]|nr:energy-coupling factor transporter transmembrane protein EcfT [Defluviitaleaceae bacterium]
MLNNITIGQYYPVKSVIHAMDARVKLLCTIIFFTIIFFISGFLGYAFAVICLATVIKLSKVPPKFMLRGLRAIMFIILFTAFLNIFFTAGTTVLFSIGFVNITLEGLLNAARMSLRFIMLIVSGSVLTLTTTPIQLTSAIEYSLAPLKRIGVPSHEIAMMMTIALRFIPTLIEEMDKIMKAQMARGADFDTGGIIKKAKSMVPLLVPLFISSFRRADDLALAMEARCYRGDINRTKMKEMRLTNIDYKAYILTILFIGGIVGIEIITRRFGLF